MATEVQNITDTTKGLENQQPEIATKIDESTVSNEVQDVDHEEAKVFTDLFNEYDTEKTGKIKAEHLYEVASMLGKDDQNVDEVLKNNKKTKDDLITLADYKHLIAELDKANTSVVESEASTQSQRVIITPDPKVLEFIKLLYAFQKKCEKEGKYGEAKLAQEKMEEIKLKEILRQENNIRSFQEEELAQVEQAQKEQYEEFSKVWDKYMTEYEAKALDSLDKLKEKHIKEVEELNERLKRELAFHFKSSKQLIELRQKESALVKLKKYGEAEKIKSQADALEQFERASKEKEIEDIIDKKTVTLRGQQQKSLAALLKRIQKDREQQLKNRELDSQKLLTKNKNLRNELISKHANEAKNALDTVRNNLSIVNSVHLNQNNKKLNGSTLTGRSSVKSAISNDSPTKAEGK